MTDKDVERNVRSTTVEGIRTPTQRHVRALGEKHAISFGEKAEARKSRERLLEKFRRRESRRPSTGLPAERKAVEPEARAGDRAGDSPGQDIHRDR